ncbi:MAG: hypothetical protein ACRDLQ_08840, partial [Solirubrobacterales bacterium]
MAERLGEVTEQLAAGEAQRSATPAPAPSASTNAARIVASSIPTGTPAATAVWHEPNVRPPSGVARN